MTGPDEQALLSRIETFYDAVPRARADIEEVDSFTLFIAQEEVGHPFYARPSLGAQDFTADEVRRVLRRQLSRGVPANIEWVCETTPALLAAAQQIWPVNRYPLLVHSAPADPASITSGGHVHCRTLQVGDPDSLWAQVTAAIDAGFRETNEISPQPHSVDKELTRAGLQYLVGAFQADEPIGGGVAMIREGVAELAGIAVLPKARRQGIGTALTEHLTQVGLEAGATTVFLTAGSDAAAEIYRRAGYRDLATAAIFELPPPSIQWLTAQDWSRFREIRMAALADAPHAFSGTYADAQQQSDAHWQARCNNVVSLNLADTIAAIAGLYLTPDRPGEGFVWGVWTRPQFRRLGFCGALLNAIIDRARSENVTTLSLHVNPALPGASASYRKAGFAPTGARQPLREGSDQIIEEFTLRLS